MTIYINGLDELPGISKLKLYPNPVNDKLFISFQATEDNFISFKLFNSIGKEVRSINNLSTSAGGNTHELQVDHLSTGIYTIQFWVDGKMASGKVIVE